jgi:uncharacterized protein (TIGR02186 family)
MKRLALAVLAILFSISPVAAERLVSQLSTDLIEITSSYDGERITFFGSIEPEAGAELRFVEGPFHVVIVVTGPAQARVARQKTRNFGIWINTDQVVFDRFPSYFQVLSSGRLLDITSPTTLAVENILPEAQPTVQDEAGWWKSSVFGRELVRLMTQKGFFGLSESGVQFLSNTTYAARLTLPSDAPPGSYLASTYVFKNGEIVARRSEGFAVRKTGFERFLAVSATQQPFVYGVACVAIALFTGWLGGVIFRR